MIFKKVFAWLFLAALVFTSALGTTTVKADEYTSMIKAIYSSNITPQKGDVFKIVYKKVNDKKEQSFEIDASLISENYIGMNLPTGLYEVLSIEYKGNNEVIKREGYAIQKNFEAKLDGLGIKIYIGAAQRNIRLSFSDTTITESGVDYELTSNETQVAPTTNTETANEEIENTESVTTGQINQNVDKEELSVEHYDNIEKKNEKSGNSSLMKLIPIIIIGIGGGIAIFVMHKKGKI